MSVRVYKYYELLRLYYYSIEPIQFLNYISTTGTEVVTAFKFRTTYVYFFQFYSSTRVRRAII